MQDSAKAIAQYYDACECDYRTFWNLDRSLAMHAGFWDQETKTLEEALERENAFLAEFAGIKPGERVLDAGCGVGGSSIFLAARYGCRVTGITLSQKQAESARRHACSRGVSSLADFETMDFCQTHFPDASFDVVWGLESVCHAQDKLRFVREAYRLLKPGGRLVVADGFAKKSAYSPKESSQMRRWLCGWGVDALDRVPQFNDHLLKTGFEAILYKSITRNVLPSSKRLFWISLPAYVFSRLGEWMGKRTRIQTENIRAAYYQYTTLKKELWEYGVFYARK